MSTKVLIIGGGVGGLALAHGCKKQGIPFHVFEKDRTEAYRAQGYRIRIGGPAVVALEYLLDEKTYSDFELSCADIRLADIPEFDAETGRLDEPNVDEQLRAKLDGGPKAWCVDRSTFRGVLIKHLGEADISYDRVFERYEETSDGVIAHFADGSEVSGTLIVGAEGRGSNVRKQLVPQLEILETGVRCIYGKTPLSSELLNTLQPAAGERMSFVKDRSHEALAVMALEPISFPHRTTLKERGLSCPPDYLFWVLTGVPEALGFGHGENTYLSPEESEQRALQVSEHWHPGLRTIIEHQQKGESSAFSITAVNGHLPVWETNQHVTVIGDAIHPMAPTGSGAVMALNDAHILCRLIHEQRLSRSAVQKYEEQMRETAEKAIQTSWMVIKTFAKMNKSNEKHVGQMAMMVRAKNTASR